MAIAETLFRPLLRGPLETRTGGTDPFASRTAIGSGVVTVTVSTAMVNSDSIILLGTQISSAGIISSGGAVAVNSIVSGVSFALTRETGVAAPWTTTVMWVLLNPS